MARGSANPPWSNYFEHPSAAKRYATARPHVHPAAIARFREVVGPGVSFERALDVGCGTGLSTVAVAEIATSVVGIDAAAGMLEQARPAPNVEYRHAPAERIPFADGSFDLVTVACAMHWFDQDRFVQEARRVLRPGGWLAVYNHWFTGRMLGNAAFDPWFREYYLVRFPSPPRGSTASLPDTLGRGGFALVSEDDLSNDVAMTLAQFVAYLTTQSNVISAVEQGTETIEDVTAWLTGTASPLFDGQPQTMLFAGKLWSFRNGAD